MNIRFIIVFFIITKEKIFVHLSIIPFHSQLHPKKELLKLMNVSYLKTEVFFSMQILQRRTIFAFESDRNMQNSSSVVIMEG